MMKILAKAKHKYDGSEEYYNRLPKASQVKRLGDYLTKNKNPDLRLTGVYKVEQPPNQYLIYTTIMYQIDPEVRKSLKRYQKEFQGKEEDIYEMNILINITTYGQYIRIYFVQLDEYEQNLGYMRLEPEELMSLPYCKDKVQKFIKNKIEKKYADEGYEVLI